MTQSIQRFGDAYLWSLPYSSSSPLQHDTRSPDESLDPPSYGITLSEFKQSKAVSSIVMVDKYVFRTRTRSDWGRNIPQKSSQWMDGFCWRRSLHTCVLCFCLWLEIISNTLVWVPKPGLEYLMVESPGDASGGLVAQCCCRKSPSVIPENHRDSIGLPERGGKTPQRWCTFFHLSKRSACSTKNFLFKVYTLVPLKCREN